MLLSCALFVMQFSSAFTFYLNKSQSVNIFVVKCTINDLSLNKMFIKSDGIDHRFNEYDIDYDLMQRIRENYEKYKILKYLESDRVSILDKLQKIKEFDSTESGIIKPPNLKAGDLTKEWDFNI